MADRMGKTGRTEADFDVLLAHVLEAEAVREYENLEQEMTGFTHDFSPEFTAKMETLLQERTPAAGRKNVSELAKQKENTSAKKTRSSGFRLKWRLALVAILLMAAASAATLANENLRHFFQNIFLTITEEGVEFESGPAKDNPIGEFQIYRLPKVEGYTLSREEVDKEFKSYSAFYKNEDGSRNLYYEQFSGEHSSGGVTYDAKKGAREPVSVNGLSGYYISDGEYGTVIFEHGDENFLLNAPESEKWLLDLARQIKFEK